MKAIVCERYGSAEVLELREVDEPAIGATDILIRVAAAAVTPSDCAFRQADPFIVRLMYGLTRPKFPVLGVELAGEVVAVGAAVTAFRPGDQVFGTSTKRFGAYAESICLDESETIVARPAGLSPEAGVSLCDGALTALTFLRDVARIQPGQRVLVNGASGAVGAAAVQVARHLGASVTAVCSGGNAELVRTLGAEAVIDYTRENFTRPGMTYDVVFDAIGKSSFARCRAILAPGGLYLSTVPRLGLLVQMLLTHRSRGQKAKFVAAGLMQTKATLSALADLGAAGTIVPVIDRRYPLSQIAEAHRYVETGRKKGSVILSVSE